jgi:hypothetical protein
MIMSMCLCFASHTEISAEVVKGVGTVSSIMMHCGGRKHCVRFEDQLKVKNA